MRDQEREEKRVIEGTSAMLQSCKETAVETERSEERSVTERGEKEPCREEDREG